MAEDQVTDEDVEVAEQARLTGDDDICWICGAATISRHCKIVCLRCGFLRDCSDP